MALVACTNCAAKISEKAAACPKCKSTTPHDAAPKICEECGTQVAHSVQVCPECGNPDFGHQPQSKARAGAKTARNKDLTWAAIVKEEWELMKTEIAVGPVKDSLGEHEGFQQAGFLIGLVLGLSLLLWSFFDPTFPIVTGLISVVITPLLFMAVLEFAVWASVHAGVFYLFYNAAGGSDLDTKITYGVGGLLLVGILYKPFLRRPLVRLFLALGFVCRMVPVALWASIPNKRETWTFYKS